MHMILLGAALFLSGPAAQDTTESAPVTVEETFSKMDTDASGGVDEVEFVAFAGEGSETQFTAIAGEDGTITLDELTSYMEDLAGDDSAGD